MVYVWLVDDLRRQYDIALLASIIGGAGGEEIPLWNSWREQFEDELHAPPVEDSDESVLLRGLGLGSDR